MCSPWTPQVLEQLEDPNAAPVLISRHTVPLCGAAQIFPSFQHGRTSLLQACFESNNTDLFKSAVVRSVIQFKWQTYGYRGFRNQFLWYMVDVLLLVAFVVVLNASFTSG